MKNPWHTVFFPSGVIGDFIQEDVWLYAQLGGGIGTFNLTVHVYDERGKRIGQSPPLPTEFQGGITVVEAVFQITMVPIDEPGIFDFSLLANHAELEGGLIRLRVLAEKML